MTPRERMLAALLVLNQRLNEGAADDHLAQALLAFEGINGSGEGNRQEQLYGLPLWLVDRFDSTVERLVAGSDPRLAGTATLLFGDRGGGDAPSEERVQALRAAVAEARRGVRPAGERFKAAVFSFPGRSEFSDLGEAVLDRRTLLDLPLKAEADGAHGVLGWIELAFKPGNPNRPTVRAMHDGVGTEFEGGVLAGLQAAQDLMLALEVPAEVERAVRSPRLRPERPAA